MSMSAVSLGELGREEKMPRKKPGAAKIEKSGRVAGGQDETELSAAVLDIIRKILTESLSADGKDRLFPNGIGLVELGTTLDLSKFTLSARIADVQYHSAPAKPMGHFELHALKALLSADDVLAYCEMLDSTSDPVMTDCNAFVKKVCSPVWNHAPGYQCRWDC